jgi:hypothetical protein
LLFSLSNSDHPIFPHSHWRILGAGSRFFSCKVEGLYFNDMMLEEIPLSG